MAKLTATDDDDHQPKEVRRATGELVATLRPVPASSLGSRRRPHFHHSTGRGLRGWGTSQVEAALWLSVVVCSGPLRAVVKGTLVARPAMGILEEAGATGPVMTVGRHRL